MKSEKKVRKFSDLTDAELNDKLKDLKSELFNLRFQNATGQLQNPMQIGLCKKDIARVKTLLRERELAPGRVRREELKKWKTREISASRERA